MTLPMSLIALAIASFGIGTTEFVIMGLLPEVAGDLNVTIPAAGLLIGGYALSVTFGSPIMALMLGRLSRKTALLLLMVVFIVGNFLCAIAPTYELLMAARLLTALCHGTFFGIGSVVATTLVPPSQRSRAVSIVFSGLTLANILGVPAGTALGQWAGWRATFLAIVPIGVVALCAIWRWLPRQGAEKPDSLARQVKVLATPRVMLPMLVSTLLSASLFSCFTYITPILQNVSGFSPQGVTSVLMLFGVGITAGNLLGGRLADWRQMTSIIGLSITLVFTLLILAAVLVSPLAAAAAVAGWGFVHFAACTPLQFRVVDSARDAPNLASTLNQSAFNLGNAVGAWIGAQALLSGVSYAHLPLLSAILAVVAVAVASTDAFLSRRSETFAIA